MRLKCVEDYGGEIMITLMGSPGHKRLRYAIGEKKHSLVIKLYEQTAAILVCNNEWEGEGEQGRREKMRGTGQSFPLSLCGPISICRANAHMVYG